jgi:hypothetical protein
VRDLVIAREGGLGVVGGVYVDSDTGVTVGNLAPRSRTLRKELVLSLACKGYVSARSRSPQAP